MLTENDVVEAVANYLRADGWHVVGMSNTSERGHDILAKKNGMMLAVEAKGETSSKHGSARYGTQFSRNQKLSHVSRALYKAASVFSAGQYSAGIALPATDRHRELIMGIKPALAALNVSVFLVDSDRTVSRLGRS